MLQYLAYCMEGEKPALGSGRIDSDFIFFAQNSKCLWMPQFLLGKKDIC